MSIITWFQSFTSIAEADLMKLAVNIKQDIQVAESDLAKGAAWLTANLPTVLNYLSEVEAVLAALAGSGVTITPAASTALATALKLGADAAASLAAYTADINAGKPQTIALADAYAAFVNAKGAAAQAAVAALSLPAPTTAAK